MRKAFLACDLQADFDVIGLLHFAQEHGADQLAQFCLHFVATNFQPMSKRDEFKTLRGDNLAYVTEHQWPPVSYQEDLRKYEKEVQDQGGDASNCVIQ